MTIDTWLRSATKTLEAKAIQSARLDCLILLEDVLEKNRSWILAYPEHILSTEDVDILNRSIKRRLQHEPLAYIRGKSEFYSREFLITPDILQPRPETETMVELLLSKLESLENIESPINTVIDIGTGSGCLAITMKLEQPKLEVHATEVNENALKIARSNMVKLDADIKLYHGDLLSPVSEIKNQKPNIAILANLPYVPNSHTINQAAMQEPAIAIFGGEDGLDLYRELFIQISNYPWPIKNIFTESLPFQHKDLGAISSDHGYKLDKTQDLIQVYSRQ